MSAITHGGMYRNNGITDGLHVMTVAIQNSTATGAIILHDSWNAIQFHAAMVTTRASTDLAPHVITGLPVLLNFDGLATDGSNNDTGMVSDSQTGSTKSIKLHKTGGEWRLRHTSHGHNYNYIVVFTLVST